MVVNGMPPALSWSMIPAADSRCMEVSVPSCPRTAKGNILVVFLAAAAFLISGSVTASPNPSTQQEQLNSPPTIAVGVTVLNSLPKGVDFESYMHNLHSSIKRNLSANLPESVVNGKKGVVVVRVRVQKDGSLSDDALTIATSSRKKDMDDASLNAIRAAAPFGRFPEGYLGSNLDLKFAFFYNIPQKSKSGPVG
jgi:TonB family protein